MPAFLVCSGDSQSSVKVVRGFIHLALSRQCLRLTRICHERKACVGVRTAYFDSSLEKSSCLSIALRLIEPISEHFKESNLVARVATPLGRKKSVANHYRGVSVVPLQKSDETKFSSSPRFPLSFP